MSRVPAEYKSFEFEPTTVEEAAGVLCGGGDTVVKDPKALKPKATYIRRPLLKGSLTLLPETKRWVAELPRTLRPLNLAAQFPRVANMLALSWAYAPGECKQRLTSLVIDDRGDRVGFPAEVLAEVVALRVHHDLVYPEMDRDVWEPAINSRRA